MQTLERSSDRGTTILVAQCDRGPLNLCQASFAGIVLRHWPYPQRRGCGKLRHLHIGQLWIQERVQNKDVHLRKVLGEENPADLFTKHICGIESVDKLVKLMNCHFKGGRPAIAPTLMVGQGATKGKSLQVRPSWADTADDVLWQGPGVPQGRRRRRRR